MSAHEHRTPGSDHRVWGLFSTGFMAQKAQAPCLLLLRPALAKVQGLGPPELGRLRMAHSPTAEGAPPVGAANTTPEKLEGLEAGSVGSGVPGHLSGSPLQPQNPLRLGQSTFPAPQAYPTPPPWAQGCQETGSANLWNQRQN